MEVKVKLFSLLKDVCGFQERIYTLHGEERLSELVQKVIAGNDEAAAMEHRLLYAVNGQYASVDCMLNEGDEVAIFPPVSGG